MGTGLGGGRLESPTFEPQIICHFQNLRHCFSPFSNFQSFFAKIFTILPIFLLYFFWLRAWFFGSFSISVQFFFWNFFLQSFLFFWKTFFATFLHPLPSSCNLQPILSPNSRAFLFEPACLLGLNWNLVKKKKFGANPYNSGSMRVARGGSGAKSPPLAARPVG